MSTVAATSKVDRAVRFYDSTIGKKAIMAVSGLILFGFLIAHMLGNLQIFLGAAVMNAYAETLHGNPGLLWGTRIILLVSVLLHIWSSFSLYALKKAARPVAYVKPGNVQASLASRTMMLSGPIILIFIIYHLLHLTTGTVHPQFIPLQAYENVVVGFRQPAAAIFYIVAMVFVGWHLSHGIWSMFQSVGFSHPRYTPLIKKVAFLGAWLLIAGFISVPLAVLFGVLR